MPEASLPYQVVGPQVPTKDRLLQAAAKLFTLKGYNATSIDEIANACNIQKPSFYGHFTSKEAIALATIKDLHGYCDQHLFSINRREELTATQRIDLFADQLVKFFQERPDYALASFLGTHVVKVIDNIGMAVQSYFSDWLAAIKAVLEPSIGAMQATQQACQSMIRLQGAMLMQRIVSDEEYMQQTYNTLTKEWRTLSS